MKRFVLPGMALSAMHLQTTLMLNFLLKNAQSESYEQVVGSFCSLPFNSLIISAESTA